MTSRTKNTFSLTRKQFLALKLGIGEKSIQLLKHATQHMKCGYLKGLQQGRIVERTRIQSASTNTKAQKRSPNQYTSSDQCPKKNIDPEQAQRDKDMQKESGTVNPCKVVSRSFNKHTYNNLELSQTPGPRPKIPHQGYNNTISQADLESNGQLTVLELGNSRQSGSETDWILML
ncbi:hypothetical protein Tco_0608407 [Tanacetum coccineum]